MNHPLKIAIVTTDARHWLGESDTTIPNFGSAIRALLEGFAQIPEVEVHVISASPSPLKSNHKLAENIQFHHLHVTKWGWGKSLFLGVASSIRKLIQKIQPDIVHGQGTERDCAMAAVLSGFPNVVTIHGNMQVLQQMGLQGNPTYGWLVSNLETFALKRTCGVFCNSAYTRNLVAPRAKNTWLVPNPIRSAFFGPSTAEKRVHTVPQILNVGLITERKRQTELLRTVGEIVRSGHRMHIIFVGDLAPQSDYGKTFLTEFEQAKAAGYASNTGFLDLPDMINLMDQSDGFVHFPSEEAFGLVVPEAMSRGLKFFGANLGGIVDIAAGIDGAELHDDLDQLRAAIIRWLDAGHPAPACAAQDIARRYHPAAIAREHVRIYREVIGG